MVVGAGVGGCGDKDHHWVACRSMGGAWGGWETLKWGISEEMEVSQRRLWDAERLLQPLLSSAGLFWLLWLPSLDWLLPLEPVLLPLGSVALPGHLWHQMLGTKCCLHAPCTSPVPGLPPLLWFCAGWGNWLPCTVSCFKKHISLHIFTLLGRRAEQLFKGLIHIFLVEDELSRTI